MNKTIEIAFKEDTWKYINDCLLVSLKGYQKADEIKIHRIIKKIESELYGEKK